MEAYFLKKKKKKNFKRERREQVKERDV